MLLLPLRFNSLSRIDVEHASVPRMVTCGNRPGQADAQEHVHRIAAGHVADAGVSVLVLDGGHFAGERVCTTQMAGSGGGWLIVTP